METSNNSSKDQVGLQCGTEIERGFDAVPSESNNFFDEATLKALNSQGDGLKLYRQIVPPKVPNLAFVGFMMANYNTVLTQAIRSLWLEKLIMGELPQPSQDVMRVRMNKEAIWKQSLMETASARDAVYQYHEQLCKDMRLPLSAPNLESNEPYKTLNYEELFKKSEMILPQLNTNQNPNTVPQI